MRGRPGARAPRRARTWLFLTAGLLAAAAAVLILPAAAAAETVINETSTSFLYTLDAADSPYLLSHDFTVQPGGTLYVGPGVELLVENGAVIRGAGGDINVQGTASQPAVVRARPGAPAPAWGGFVLGAGSDLVVQDATLHNGTPMVSANAGASVWVNRATVDGCGGWCVLVYGLANVTLGNSSFADAVWGYYDNGSDRAALTNLSFSNFSGPAASFHGPVTHLAVAGLRVVSAPLGVVASGVVIASFSQLDVHASTGPALSGTGGTDMRVLNSTLVSDGGVAVDVGSTTRLTVEGSDVRGAGGAVRLAGAVSPTLRGNTLRSSGGPCLELAGVSQGLLEANALAGCARALLVPPGASPPNATAGPTNTVDGKPFLWVDGADGAEIGASGAAGWGLVVLVGVDNARVTDLHLDGAGVYAFGCTNLTLERLHVTGAEAAVTAVGSRGLRVVALRAEDVGTGVAAWSEGPGPAASADLLIERARVERASVAAVSIAGASNVSVRWMLVVDSTVGVRIDGSAGALVANVITRGAGTGVWFSNTTDAVVVDSAFETSSVLGLLVKNTTGMAARNAFVDNTDHASAPGSPSFAFNEILAGNYWTNWSAPDANGDGWADIPYNLTDGTGADMRPRMVRWDFHPTALPAAPAVVELGTGAVLDASPSFDDFSVGEYYWEVRAPGDNVTGQSLSFLWTANATGVHTVTLSVVGSFGASDEYAFPVLVIDTGPPDFSFGPLPTAEAGANLTVVLSASDNDPRFPAGARVEWSLEGASGPVRSGNSTALALVVLMGPVGNYTLRATVFDAAGNSKSASVAVDVGDTEGPDIQIAFEGQPDLGIPFFLDATATYDASGVDDTSARWTWVEAGVTKEIGGFPIGELTFDHAGNYTVAFHLCDRLGNCGGQQVQLKARDTRGPRLIKIHVVAPQREAVDIFPGNAPTVEARVGEEVVFEVDADDPSGEVTFLWDFGDGTTAEGRRVVHTFERSGDLTVNLVMTDPLGNTNPAAFHAHVLPGAGFFGEIIPGVSGDLVVLVAVIAAAGATAFLYVRRRRPPREDADRSLLP